MSREADDFISKIRREVPGFVSQDDDLLRYLVDELIAEVGDCDRRHVSLRMADALDILPDNFSMDKLAAWIVQGAQSGVLNA